MRPESEPRKQSPMKGERRRWRDDRKFVVRQRQARAAMRGYLSRFEGRL